jgi:hypothetical protein
MRAARTPHFAAEPDMEVLGSVMTDANPLEPEPRLGGEASRGLIAGALAIGVVLVAAKALLPTTHRWDLVTATTPLLVAAAALVGYALSLRRGAAAARFEVSEGVAFTAPANRAYGYSVAANVLLATVFDSFAIGAWTVLSGRQVAVWLTVVSFVLSVIIAVAAVRALGGRPGLDLTPHTLISRQLLGTVTVPWPALTAEAAAASLRYRVGQPWLVLVIDRPDLVRRRGLAGKASNLSVMWLRVEPSFLADAVHFYAQHPERQASIGTRAEHDRLAIDLGR